MNRPVRLKAPAPVLSLLLLLGVTGPAVAISNTERHLQVADQHIVPAYTALAESTAALDEAARSFCSRPGPEGLESLRSRYGEAMDTWQAVQHVRFGPIDYLMRYHRFEFWPDKRGTVGKHLGRLFASQDLSALEPENFGTGSVALQGSSALERLLFGTEVAPSQFAGGDEQRFRCALLQAITGNLARMSSGVVVDWVEGEGAYRDYFETASMGNAYYADSRELDSALLNTLYTQMQVIVEQKLDRPLGESAARPFPKRAESWRSGRSLENIRYNLLGTRALYRTAFEPLVKDQRLARAIREVYEKALKDIAAVPVPLSAAVGDTDGRRALEALQADVIRLEQLISGPLSEALNIPLGFNSLDGD